MFSRFAIALNVAYVVVVATGFAVAPSRSHAVPGAVVLVALAALCIAGLVQPKKLWLRLAALGTSGLFFTLIIAGLGVILWRHTGLISEKPIFVPAVLFMAIIPGVTAIAFLKHK